MAGNLIPGDDKRCVWMTAGLVAYKLCDRGFDCDGCPFDRALRGGPAVAGGPLAGERPAARPPRPPQPTSWAFPADRRYHPAHTWVADLGGDRVRIGLDGFAARLLGHVGAVILPPPGSRLREGRCACWLEDGGEPIPLRAPVGGTVRRRNGEVRRRPALATADPYDLGWLMDLDLGGADAERAGGGEPVRGWRLVDAATARSLAERRLAELAREIAGAAGETAKEVGPTLADGGEPRTDLRTLLGADRFRRLALRYLG
jgi:glycine cleavage system H protein